MKNPFRPGNGIEPPYLAGRTPILKEFEESLEEFEGGLPRNMIIFGLRGTGKTVIMKHFGPIAKNKGWLAVSREFNRRFCDETQFAEAIVNDVISKVSEISLTKRLQKQGKRFFDLAKPEEIGVKGITYKPFYKEQKELLDDYLKNMLIDNWNAIKKSKAKGLVFLYDEFHTVKDGSSTENYPLASLLGALSHAQREGCRYYLAVSGLPNLTTNLKDAKTYTERMFTYKEISNLPEAEGEKAIRIPIKKLGYSFEEKLIKQIVKETKGYPYFLQFYCYFLVKNRGSKRITLADYESIRNKLLEELDISFYQDRFQKATPGEQAILEAMARISGEEVSPTEILKILKIDKAMVFIYLKNLIDKNLVYRSGRGKYSFTIPLFKEFLLRKGGVK